jgi:hypothetical protein
MQMRSALIPKRPPYEGQDAVNGNGATKPPCADEREGGGRVTATDNRLDQQEAEEGWDQAKERRQDDAYSEPLVAGYLGTPSDNNNDHNEDGQ